MSNNTKGKLDLILQKAIRASIMKKVAWGEFTEIATKENPEKYMKMALEMAAVPKYRDIKEQIKGANGIINFVTGGQYQPLVEAILQSSIPPSHNDVYHMGVGYTAPGDYDVDAAGYFGATMADNKTQINSVKIFENLILGDPLKKTPEYYASIGVSDRRLTETFGKDIWPKIKQMFDMLKAREQEVERGSAKSDMVSAHIKISKTYQDMRRNQETRRKNEENKMDPKYVRQNEVEILNDEALTKLKNVFEEARGDYLALKRASPKYVSDVVRAQNAESEDAVLWTRASEIFLSLMSGGEANSFSKKVQRDKNGFVDWNPASELLSLSYELFRQHDQVVTNPSAREEMSRALLSLLGKLKEYESSDRNIMAKKKQIFDIIGESVNNSSQQTINYIKNQARISKLLYDIINDIKNHGSVIVFSNVDDSLLKSKTGLFSGVLDQFKNKLDVMASLSQSKSSVFDRKKSIVFVSNTPLEGLGGNAEVITMPNLPVDDDEAEIIVRNILETDFGRHYRDISLFNGESEIEQKYNMLQEKGMSKDLLRQKNRERMILNSSVDSTYDTIKPGETLLTDIEGMIVGLGQNSAINLVKKTIRECIEVTKDPETDAPTAIKLDANKWAASCITMSNKLHDANVPGLSVRKSKVKFEDYIYAKTTHIDSENKSPMNWGQIVGDFGQKGAEVFSMQIAIDNLDKELLEIEKQLHDPQISAESKLELQNVKSNYWVSREQLRKERFLLMKNLPHIMILYGKPGVGKSVFADALADLFKFVIRSVDFDKAKDKWVGSTEQNVDKVIGVIKSSRKTVILIDELDRTVRMEKGEQGGGGSSGESATHPVDATIIKKLLDLFENDKDKLISNDVFIIITTNFAGNFDAALVSRTQGNVHEVLAPDDPEDYKRFISTFLRTEKADTPQAPWVTSLPDFAGFVGAKESIDTATALSDIKGKEVTIEDYWQELNKLVNSVDIDRICRIFAKRRLGFRALSGLMRAAILAHGTYSVQRKIVERGESKELKGMPFNTENLCHAAMMARDDSSDPTENTNGVKETVTKLKMSIDDKMKKIPLERKEIIEILKPNYTQTQIISLLKDKKATIVKSGFYRAINQLAEIYLNDPTTSLPVRDKITKKLDKNGLIARVELDSTNNIVMGYQFPTEFNIEKEMTCEETPEVKEGYEEEFEAGEQVIGDPNDPTARRVPYVKRKTPPAGQTMDELVEKGMEESTISPEPVVPETKDVVEQEIEITDDTDEKKKDAAKENNSPGAKDYGSKTKKEEEGVKKSTTDYYYQFLKEAGFFKKESQIVNVQNDQKDMTNWYDDVEKYGVYYGHNGQMFIAPAGNETPQYLSVTKKKE